jgi:hypothetical protein
VKAKWGVIHAVLTSTLDRREWSASPGDRGYAVPIGLEARCLCRQSNTVVASSQSLYRQSCINIQHDQLLNSCSWVLNVSKHFINLYFPLFSLQAVTKKDALQYGYKGRWVDLVKCGEQVSGTWKCRLLLNEQNEVVTGEIFPQWNTDVTPPS